MTWHAVRHHFSWHRKVVPAKYAFVVHTANPLTGARGELFGEAVVGMGEALVGNFPGRALSFVAPSAAGGQVGRSHLEPLQTSTTWRSKSCNDAIHLFHHYWINVEIAL